MSTDTTEMPELVIERVLSVQSDLALDKFVELNPHMRGATWADVLSVLDDGDAHLAVTEPIYEALHKTGFVRRLGKANGRYITLVTLTLLWANTNRPPSPFDVEGAVRTVLGDIGWVRVQSESTR